MYILIRYTITELGVCSSVQYYVITFAAGRVRVIVTIFRFVPRRLAFVTIFKRAVILCHIKMHSTIYIEKTKNSSRVLIYVRKKYYHYIILV